MEIIAWTGGYKAFQSLRIGIPTQPFHPGLPQPRRQGRQISNPCTLISPDAISSSREGLTCRREEWGWSRGMPALSTIRLRGMPLLPPPLSRWAPVSSVVSPDSHLLKDTVQCFWPANVKADEHSIRIWVGPRPDIVIVRGPGFGGYDKVKLLSRPVCPRPRVPVS